MEIKKTSFFACVVRVLLSCFVILCVTGGCTPDHGNLENTTGASAVTYTPFQTGVGVTKESEQWILKAIQSLKTHQYQKASEEVNKALRYDSQNSYLHYLNGLIYHLWGLSKDPTQLSNAIVGYQIALKFDPGNAFAMRNLGKLYLDSHQYTKAQNQYANGVLSDPTNTSMVKGLVISSYLDQDVETALQAIKLLEKDGKISSDTYRVAALVYAAAGDSTTAHTYFQKMQKETRDAHVLKYIESRLKAWKEFYLIVSKKDLEKIADTSSHPAKEEKFLTKLKSRKFNKNIEKKLNAVKKGLKNKNKEKKKKPATSNTDKQAFAYLDYLEQGAADDDFGDDSDNSSDGGFGGSGGDGSDDSSGGGFGGTGSDDSDDSSDGGFGGSGGDDSDDSSGGGFGGSFGDDSDNSFGNSAEKGAQLANKMVVIDVAIIRTEQIENTSRGNNLLEALGNITQNGSNPLAAYGFNIAPPSTRGRTVAYSLSIPTLKYSLNIANDQNSYNDILATPTLVATNGKQSTFFSGTDVTLALTGTQGGGNLVTKEVGITLSVTPTFLPDGRISLNVNAGRTIFSQDALPGNTGQSYVTVPVLQSDKSSVQATAALSPGESLLLSGLTERYYLKSDDKVPGLGDTPVAGYLFGNATSQRIERSVLFVLTPHFAENLTKDATGNYIPLPSEEEKKKDKKVLLELKETYPSLFKVDTSKAFLAKLKDTEYSRHFRPNDMPVMDEEILPNMPTLIAEVVPYVAQPM